LREGALDLMIGSTAVDGLASQIIVTDEIVVVGGDTHPIFDKRPTIKVLSEYDWVLQDRTSITRQWLDQALESRQLPRPRVQVQTNFVLQLPLLVADTGLLSFVSRQHLFPGRPRAPLKEVRLRTTTMQRPLMAILKLEDEPAPAVRRLVELLHSLGGSMFHHRRDPAQKTALQPRRSSASQGRKGKSSPRRIG
jgi:DNA-binding transcriptional LysR family regulator